jgi:hypothetical protein
VLTFRVHDATGEQRGVLDVVVTRSHTWVDIRRIIAAKVSALRCCCGG